MSITGLPVVSDVSRLSVLLLVSALLTWQNMKVTARDKAWHPVGFPAVYNGKQRRPENNTAVSNFPSLYSLHYPEQATRKPEMCNLNNYQPEIKLFVQL